jgi:hypothetical protein
MGHPHIWAGLGLKKGNDNGGWGGVETVASLGEAQVVQASMMAGPNFSTFSIAIP